MKNKKEKTIKMDIRKFKCPLGHWFLAPIWANYLKCPANTCTNKADRVEDLDIFSDKKIDIIEDFPIC